MDRGRVVEVMWPHWSQRYLFACRIVSFTVPYVKHIAYWLDHVHGDVISTSSNSSNPY